MLKNTILLLTILFSNLAFANVIIGKGTIVHVVDGDTFDVQAHDSSILQLLINSNYVGLKHVDTRNNVFRIRLANVNTEESKHTDSSRNTQFGAKTSQIVKNTYHGEQGQFRCYKKGYYERSVCSFVTERNIDVGEWLIRNDYSPYVKSYGRHPEFHNKYVKAKHSTGNSGFEHGSVLAGQRTKHRDNEYHNGHGHSSNTQSVQRGLRVVNEKVEWIILQAEQSTQGNNLNKFINRHKQKPKSSGNLDNFINRN